MSQRLYVSHTRAEKNDRLDSPKCTWPNLAPCELDHDWTTPPSKPWWPPGRGAQRTLPLGGNLAAVEARKNQTKDARTC